MSYTASEMRAIDSQVAQLEKQRRAISAQIAALKYQLRHMKRSGVSPGTTLAVPQQPLQYTHTPSDDDLSNVPEFLHANILANRNGK